MGFFDAGAASAAASPASADYRSQCHSQNDWYSAALYCRYVWLKYCNCSKDWWVDIICDWPFYRLIKLYSLHIFMILVHSTQFWTSRDHYKMHVALGLQCVLIWVMNSVFDVLYFRYLVWFLHFILESSKLLLIPENQFWKPNFCHCLCCERFYPYLQSC